MTYINSKQKGDKAEREVKAILETWGWKVINSPRTMKRIWIKGRILWISQANDYFGLFDHCAKSEENTLWIQTKSNPTHVSEAKPGIAIFAEELCCKHETCEIWLRVSRKGFVMYRYIVSTKEWVKEYINLKGKKCERFKLK